MDVGISASIQAAKAISESGKEADALLDWFNQPYKVGNYTDVVSKIFNPVCAVPVSAISNTDSEVSGGEDKRSPRGRDGGGGGGGGSKGGSSGSKPATPKPAAPKPAVPKPEDKASRPKEPPKRRKQNPLSFRRKIIRPLHLLRSPMLQLPSPMRNLPKRRSLLSHRNPKYSQPAQVHRS